jgi:putative phosphoesterase
MTLSWSPEVKIALCGDIHANLPALETVLAHARSQNVSAIWNTGDFLGYGAFPNEVVRELEQAGAISILGNYDLKVLGFKEKEKRWRKNKRAEKYLAFQWAYQNLSHNNRRYLKSLPEQRHLEVAGKSVLLTHASPASNEEPLDPATPEERLTDLARLAGTDLVICGHSHQPFVRKAENTLFINTGSVGRPDDGDPRACYAILEAEHDDVHVQHYRLDYDLIRSVTGIRENGLPEAFAQMILKGCDLDTILQKKAKEPYESSMEKS